MHDFVSFSEGAGEDDEKSTKCLVETVSITEDKDKIYIRIKASHFLWKMVRRIVGVIVEVSRIKKENEDEAKKLTSDDIRSFLQKKSDIPAKYTAPPSGLFLEKVEY
jgi:tRNA pseudouridine38-40 synthase